MRRDVAGCGMWRYVGNVEINKKQATLIQTFSLEGRRGKFPRPYWSVLDLYDYTTHPESI